MGSRLKSDSTFPHFIGIVLTFFILKLFTLRFKFSDGFTYMYMGKLISEGFIPYKDFFFASPPLQAYLMFIGEIFIGNHILLLKLIPILATIGSAFFTYNFMREKFGNREGLTASTLFLFSSLILLTTDYSTGIHLTLFFILGMIYFTEKDRPFLAGIFGSLALCTRLYAPFPIAGVGLYYLIYKKKNLLKFLIGLGTIFIPISIIFQMVSNGNYLNQILFFRLNLITDIGLSKFTILKFFIIKDFFLIIGTISYLIFNKEKKKLILPILATAFSILLLIIYSDIYYLYFGLIISFFSMFTTAFIFKFKNEKKFKKIITAFLILIVLFNSTVYVTGYASTANIDFTEDLTKFVKENSEKNETIYGSFEIAPLISILSERRLAGNIADTNPKNIMTNTFSIEDIENKIEGVKFILAKGIILNDGRIAGFDASTPTRYIKEKCDIAKIYHLKKDFSSNVVIVYNCSK